MKNNLYIGQIRGPFKAKEDLFSKISDDAAIPVNYIIHSGIQADEGTIIYINEEPVQIGITGVYEIGNTIITSLYIWNDANNNTILDYTVIPKNLQS